MEEMVGSNAPSFAEQLVIQKANVKEKKSIIVSREKYSERQKIAIRGHI